MLTAKRTGIRVGMVSSFLGNLYLTPLDDALDVFARKKGAKWFRYVDDVKVFTKSYEDAREAVFLINSVLRNLHLNLQGSKTDILFGPDLENELFDKDLEQVNELISKAENFKGSPASPQVTKLIRNATTSRTTWNELCDSGKVKSITLRKRHAQRGIKLIFRPSAEAYLKSLLENKEP